jgi:hypothetical protein
MSGEVLGLPPADWTAIGTIAITIVGIATIILNGRAGHHAKVSAQAAEKAAIAARDAAAAQRAAIEVDFEIHPLRVAGPAYVAADDMAGWRKVPFVGSIRVACRGATVWVHEVILESLWVDMHRVKIDDLPCPAETPLLPARLHRGEAVMCNWPEIPEALAGDRVWGMFVIVYSFDHEGDRLRIARRADVDVSGKQSP